MDWILWGISKLTAKGLPSRIFTEISGIATYDWHKALEERARVAEEERRNTSVAEQMEYLEGEMVRF
ncbi:MAG: hypothetical protein GY696_18705 [Gammaproteobacteria bacterium]|nr:hypothetical protein [Gammaproteobacteria bacterium]